MQAGGGEGRRDPRVRAGRVQRDDRPAGLAQQPETTGIDVGSRGEQVEGAHDAARVETEHGVAGAAQLEALAVAER